MRIQCLLRLVILILGFHSISVLGELGPVYGKNGVWYKARLTWYESYPKEDSEECIKYNGCEHAGYFAFVGYQKSKEWVQDNNIIAVHSEHTKWLALKKLRLRVDPEDESNEIVGTVYDFCSDDDCYGCCTRNAKKTGYLIDLEVSTLLRLGFTKDNYPEFIYFMVYETKKEKLKREIKEIKKEMRVIDKKIKKEERKLEKTNSF